MTSADGVSKVMTAAFLTSHSISPSIRTSLTPIKKGRQLNTNCTKHFPHPQNKDDNHKARQDIIIIDHKVHHLILMTMVTPEVLIPMIHGVHCR
mmetsp:Transcript_36838/g.55077  ORF Transcript_36838/g.55077 Transcript_36838/m.55077 type:complete len:94 (+) Transcript_36838:510-791(+)